MGVKILYVTSSADRSSTSLVRFLSARGAAAAAEEAPARGNGGGGGGGAPVGDPTLRLSSLIAVAPDGHVLAAVMGNRSPLFRCRRAAKPPLSLSATVAAGPGRSPPPPPPPPPPLPPPPRQTRLDTGTTVGTLAVTMALRYRPASAAAVTAAAAAVGHLAAAAEAATAARMGDHQHPP